jgi:hypothetical protein
MLTLQWSLLYIEAVRKRGQLRGIVFGMIVHTAHGGKFAAARARRPEPSWLCAWEKGAKKRYSNGRRNFISRSAIYTAVRRAFLDMKSSKLLASWLLGTCPGRAKDERILVLFWKREFAFKRVTRSVGFRIGQRFNKSCKILVMLKLSLPGAKRR